MPMAFITHKQTISDYMPFTFDTYLAHEYVCRSICDWFVAQKNAVYG